MDMTAKQIFKRLYRHVRQARYVNHLNAFAEGREEVQPSAYMLVDGAERHVIFEHDAPIRLTVTVGQAAIWATHWRFEERDPSVPKWLSGRHYNCYFDAEGGRVWYKHPGIPGVTRELGTCYNQREVA